MFKRLTLSLITIVAVGCGSTAYIPADSSGMQRMASADVIDTSGKVTSGYLQNTREGYFWLGYNAFDAGVGDLKELGGGQGFTVGTGILFSETSRSFFEFGYRKTVGHTLLTNASGEKAYHESYMVGLKKIILAQAREKNQPRLYFSGGFSQEEVNAQTKVNNVNAEGFGGYFGFGTEKSISESSSFSFDYKRHFWKDSGAVASEGENPATDSFTLLLLQKF